MKTLTTTNSSKFPPSYGDFALLCSDGVICYFPRYLLGYMSGFFKDMFDLPNNNVQLASPLSLTEPSGTIELLLQHIDLKTPPPDIDAGTIVDLLEAAQKYQVPTIYTWFENEIEHRRVLVQNDLQKENLVLSNPSLVFYCALRFKRLKAGQLALKQLIQCESLLDLLYSQKDITVHELVHCMRLQNDRLEEFMKFTNELGRMQMDSTSRHAVWSHHFENHRTICAPCVANLSHWITSLQQAVKRSPCWASFAKAYEKGDGTCVYCKTSSWPDYFRYLLPGWQAKIEGLEKELPEWPF